MKVKKRGVRVGPFKSVSGFGGGLPRVALSLPVRPYWAVPKLDRLPKRWAARMEAEWRRVASESKHGHGSADAWLTRRLAELDQARRAGLYPGMGDVEITRLADSEAADFAGHFATIEGVYLQRWAHMPVEYRARCIAHRQQQLARFLMGGRGVADMWPEGPNVTPAGALQRLKDPAFWRRVFRKAHARTVEQCAIALGLVRADKDCYVSKETRSIVAQRAAANAAMLAKTTAVNEHGDELTLAAIAERSVSNPTIRRGELMTRVSGFEVIADGMGHLKRWAVLTCPSRMHKWTKTDNGVFANKRYDGTQPREAQQYLAKQWRKVCLWWERQGLRVYGFRTTEPHHDGCPHWNVLCFFAPLTERVETPRTVKEPKAAAAVWDQGLLKYFLHNDSPTEPGAALRRVKIEAITSDKGSAAAYIAKYISKGVDGYRLEADLYGNPIEQAVESVVAWARVWGIRQFQQIGGPPVTVWRELRRLHPENVGTPETQPDTLAAALAAVNLQLVEPGEKKAVAWARYVKAQGGPTCKRKAHAVRLWKRDPGTQNRYGEAAQPQIVGVYAHGRVLAHVGHMAEMGLPTQYKRAALVGVESERAKWFVVPEAATMEAYELHCERMAGLIEGQKAAEAKRIEAARQQAEAAAVLRERLANGAAGRPWTRVNNCTERQSLSMTPTLDRINKSAAAGAFTPLKTARRKFGRFYNWKKQGEHHEFE